MHHDSSSSYSDIYTGTHYNSSCRNLSLSVQYHYAQYPVPIQTQCPSVSPPQHSNFELPPSNSDNGQSNGAYSTQVLFNENPDDLRLTSVKPTQPLAKSSSSPSINSQAVTVHTHPYYRSSAQQEPKKRGPRRIWNHALEKFIFKPHEIATLGAPHRRTIYLASLEAHIDRLHSQLLGHGLYPIRFEALLPYKGLNCKTAKGMVAGLQFDIAAARFDLLELERAAHSGFAKHDSSSPTEEQSESKSTNTVRHF